MITVVRGPVGEVGCIGVGPSEIEAAVGEGLEVGVAIVVNEGSADARERRVVILRDLCNAP